MGLRTSVIVAALAASVLAFPLPGRPQEAIFVVRHSDPPPMLRLDDISDDTPLSESGQQRAAMLAARLKDAGIAVIYASQARRTVETAEPLAKALGVQIRVHSYDDVDGMVSQLRSDHQGDRVLIVGHWSTIPLILKAFGDLHEITIERSAYDHLFVIIPRGEQSPTVLHLHY